MMVVRTAMPDDYQELASLGRRAFHEAFSQYNDPGDMQTYLDLAFNPETIHGQLLDPDVIFFIALHQQEAVGYAKLRRHLFPPELQNHTCMQLERIYALEAFIGKKVGKVLMEACIRQSREERVEYLWLSVWQQNERAIRFYKQWGFKVIGTKQFLIGKNVNDDFVMALKLDAPV